MAINPAVDLLIVCLVKKRSVFYLHKAVAVATFEVAPNLFQFLGREAFKRQPN